jgi:hypothetical protein
LIYFDGLLYATSIDGSRNTGTMPTTRLKGLELKYLGEAMDLVLKSNATSSMPTLSTGPSPRRTLPSQAATVSTDKIGYPAIIIDGIDFLLASQPEITTISLQCFLSNLRTQTQSLILTVHADDPLLQIATSADNDTGTDLERSHGHFLTSMAHQSNWIFQLRGLDTGSAKDVSGVIRVSRGASSEEDENASSQQDLKDGEWLYQLRGDGSVRVWGRGE